MNAINLKMDRREFDRTLKEYVQLNKRDNKSLMDTKGYRIALKAQAATPKADAAKIDAELGVIGFSVRQVTRGKNKGKFRKGKAVFSQSSLAEKILRARFAKAGKAQPTKEEMNDLALKFRASRARSIAFLKSGWLRAIKTLAPLANKSGAGRVDRSAKQYGQDKGYATPAKEGNRATTTIANLAGSNKENKGALHRYGGPALQTAFNQETADMKVYIEKKYRQSARQLGIKTN